MMKVLMPYAFGLRYATGAGSWEGRRALRGSGRRKPLTTDMAGDRPCSRQGTPYRWRRSGALTVPTPTGGNLAFTPARRFAQLGRLAPLISLDRQVKDLA